jgi:hypothetical protein
MLAGLLVPAGEPVVVAIDDTLFKRRGKKVWAASWSHHGSALPVTGEAVVVRRELAAGNPGGTDVAIVLPDC